MADDDDVLILRGKGDTLPKQPLDPDDVTVDSLLASPTQAGDGAALLAFLGHGEEEEGRLYLLKMHRGSVAWKLVSADLTEVPSYNDAIHVFCVKDDGSRGKRHKAGTRLDWMKQLYYACNNWKEAVLKDDSIIQPLPWPFCPIEEEDAVIEETEDEDAGNREKTEDKDAGTSEKTEDKDADTNKFKLRLFDLGENATVKGIWGKASALKIIERKSYIDLWSRISCLFETEERKAVLLLGNPGIGKTAFLLYVVLMLLQKNKKILLQTKGKQFYYFNYEGDRYSFTRLHDLYDSDLDFDEEIHFLVDSKLSDVPVYIGKCLLTATPVKSNFKEFEKDEACKKFYLPVWSASEMALLRQEVFSDVSKNVLEERYAQWGGLPRFVLEYPELQMSTVVDKMPHIQKLVSAVTSQKVDKDHPSHKLIHMKVSMNYNDFELIYASPYVREKVFESLYNEGLETLKAFLTFKGGAIQGFPQLQGGILELFFKRKAAQKASFPVFEVFQSEDPGEEKMMEFVFGEPKYVKTLDKIDPHTDHDRIIWPDKINQETVDSLELRKQTDGSYILQNFQVTLSSSKGDHGLKYAGMLNLMKMFNIAADKVEVYIVAIDSRFKNAGYQNWRIQNNQVLCATNILRKLEGIRHFVLNCGGA